MNKWIKEYPKEVGLYWFYGYRYGRVSVGEAQEPEYCLVNVKKGGEDHLFFIADGSLMYDKETEEAWFKKAEYPLPPEGFEKEVE